jgi:hypothetical protein
MATPAAMLIVTKIGRPQLILILSFTNDIIFKIIRKKFRKFGLTPEQGPTLEGIYVHGDNTTAAELARYFIQGTRHHICHLESGL